MKNKKNYENSQQAKSKPTEHCVYLGLIFLLVDVQPSYCNFLESRKKKSKICVFYPPTLNIICFVENRNIFLRFCLRIFESDTAKSDCPM